MHKKYLQIMLCFTLICFLPQAAYSFDLFDPNRGQEPPAAPVATPSPIPKPSQQIKTTPPKPTKPQQDFVLQGTVQIGKNRFVILQTPDGKAFRQKLDASGRTRIKGYEGYTLVTLDSSRQIRIEYPQDALCRKSNQQKGINCQSSGKTATMSIARKKAIATPQPVSPPSEASADPNQNDAEKIRNIFQQARDVSELTPEEVAEREEAFKRRQEIYKNFKRQVIKDEDVPPGMRVVRTPFGDRLVPDNR